MLGSLLYFGYHYRVYLGNLIHSKIVPVIVLNLVIGFITPGIDNAAHIGACTEHVTDYPLITWLSCTAHVADHAMITQLPCTGHMTDHALIT